MLKKVVSAIAVLLVVALVSYSTEIKTYQALQTWQEKEKEICSEYESRWSCFNENLLEKYHTLTVGQAIILTRQAGQALYDDKQRMEEQKIPRANIVVKSSINTIEMSLIFVRLLETKKHKYLDKLLLERYLANSNASTAQLSKIANFGQKQLGIDKIAFDNLLEMIEEYQQIINAMKREYNLDI